MSFSQNLKTRRQLKNWSQQQLADKCNIKRSTYSSYEQGVSEPSLSVLLRLSEILQCSTDELIGNNEANNGFRSKILAIGINEKNEEHIALIPQKASAGYTSGYADPEYIKQLPHFDLPFLSRGTYRAFEISGDSMLPIQSGSIIVGQYVESARYLKVGQAYIFVTQNNGILFKRLKSIDQNRLILASDNPRYESYGMPVSEITEAWAAKVFMSEDFTSPKDSSLHLNEQIKSLKSQLNSLNIS